MRPLKDIERSVAKVPIRTSDQADDAVLKDLLQEFSQWKRTSVTGRPTQTESRITGAIACLASIAILVVAVWLLHAGHARQEPKSAPASSESLSGIALLTEVSLEHALRRGGLEAVESQYEKAIAKPAHKPIDRTTEGLLVELVGSTDNTGGMNL